ncbi:hypothetical protein SETIT_6G215800v2 [Setaria italica]|uniref:BTB domain-containing protein n=1 Tax=Setaria italica TaxID=4555 RepID=A0A368RP14_SETIT|nr:BTB/POZ and MATH domain-containing protein 1 [Setaria italica]XP_034601353.1 BTB/POZ and MATH domain-containing protein 1-like [Setaria viridis]RCV31909.1 hypothetical protein SETIT_6G215800v2 [Setaria italica]
MGNPSMGKSKRQRTSGPEAQLQTTTMMDSASAVVEFKVNYEQTKHLPAGQAIKSDPISVGGQVWRINFYPRGAYEIAAISNDHFSIFLERQIMSDRPIKSIFEVLLIDKNGEPVMISSKLPPPLQRYYGNYQWLASQNYMVHNYVKDGHIKFVFTITVLPDNPIPVPPSDIGKHMATLLDGTDEGKDVSFTVDGETFHAHRAVLAARSPVFRAELLGSMAEATMSCITLHDIAPATFKAMLQFMYTDVLPGDEELGDCPTEMFENLLVAADRYALDRLKLMCAQKLWENVSVETVCDALACAEIYNCPELKGKCIEFVVADKNFKKIVLTDSFMQLGQKFPSIITEVRRRLAGI